jgi:hypothetical protein
MDGKPYTVVGAVPAGFHFDTLGPVDVFTPRVFELNALLPLQVNAGAMYLNYVARLRPDARMARAQVEMDTLAAVSPRAFRRRPMPTLGSRCAWAICAMKRYRLSARRFGFCSARLVARAGDGAGRGWYRDWGGGLVGLDAAARKLAVSRERYRSGNVWVRSGVVCGSGAGGELHSSAAGYACGSDGDVAVAARALLLLDGFQAEGLHAIAFHFDYDGAIFERLAEFRILRGALFHGHPCVSSIVAGLDRDDSEFTIGFR